MRRSLAGVVVVALAACPAPDRHTAPPPLPPPPPVDAAPIATPPTPPADLRVPAGVAPLGYRLRLTIDPAQPRFDGEVAIDLAVTATTDVVWLHADALVVDAATLADGAALAVIPDPDHQRIGLWRGAPLPARTTVQVRYHGTIVDDDPMGLFRQRHGTDRYVYTQMEGVFARRVVPCFDEPGFKVPWQLTIVAPAGLTVVANTPEASRTAAGATQEVTFAPTPPTASYLIAVAVGRFEAVTIGPVGRAAVPARVLTPAGLSAWAAAAAAATPGVVAQLEAYFDRPLPLAKLDLVAVPQFFGAMENPGLITFAAATLLDDPARPSRDGQRGMRATLAHELAHQWFGDLVTPRWWDDLWLNESFATWMAAELTGIDDDDGDAVIGARGAVERAMRADALPSARPLCRPIAGGLDVDDSFDAIAYEKGGALLAMFERRRLRRGAGRRRARPGHRVRHLPRPPRGAAGLAGDDLRRRRRHRHRHPDQRSRASAVAPAAVRPLSGQRDRRGRRALRVAGGGAGDRDPPRLPGVDHRQPRRGRLLPRGLRR